MTRTSGLTLRIAIAAAIGFGALMVCEQVFVGRSAVTTADARIGRPLTPLSYAGVARRTTRRAVVGGAAIGYGAAVAAPRAGCVQVVDAYGRIITRCY